MYPKRRERRGSEVNREQGAHGAPSARAERARARLPSSVSSLASTIVARLAHEGHAADVQRLGRALSISLLVVGCAAEGPRPGVVGRLVGGAVHCSGPDRSAGFRRTEWSRAMWMREAAACWGMGEMGRWRSRLLAAQRQVTQRRVRLLHTRLPACPQACTPSGPAIDTRRSSAGMAGMFLVVAECPPWTIATAMVPDAVDSGGAKDGGTSAMESVSATEWRHPCAASARCRTPSDRGDV